MIHNIILDIGNVLAEFRWEACIRDFHFSPEISRRLAEATVLSPHWPEFDRSFLEDTAIIQKCIESDPEIKEQILFLFQHLSDLVHEYDYAPSFVSSLKAAGYRVYLLSNYSKTGFSYVKRDFKFYPLVDGGVISYEVQKIKPEKEIYEILLAKYSLKAEECVFLDDREENLIPAEKMGFHTVLFTSKEDADKQLLTLGVSASILFPRIE